MVSERMAGLVLLQWWREALDAIAANQPPAHPVVEAVHARWEHFAPVRAHRQGHRPQARRMRRETDRHPYLKNRAAAEETVGKLRERGAEGVLDQADVSAVEDIARMFAQVREAFSLNVFVSNARPDVEQFYQPVFDIPLRNWQIAFVWT